jgi:hypothetical protein
MNIDEFLHGDPKLKAHLKYEFASGLVEECAQNMQKIHS